MRQVKESGGGAVREEGEEALKRRSADAQMTRKRERGRETERERELV